MIIKGETWSPGLMCGSSLNKYRGVLLHYSSCITHELMWERLRNFLGSVLLLILVRVNIVKLYLG